MNRLNKVLLTLLLMVALTVHVVAYTPLLTVPKGGTGVSSTTAYAVLCGGTSSTAALQSVSGVGTSGQVLTSNGAGALPTFQNATGGGGLSFELDCIQGASGNLWATGSGTWTGSGTDGFGYGGNTLTNTSNGDGDYVSKEFTVPSTGTWKCRVVSNATNGSGILEVVLEGASKGTHDFYDASAGIYNQWSAEISLGSLTANAVNTLDLKVNGKNASSSGYRLYLHKVVFYQ